MLRQFTGRFYSRRPMGAGHDLSEVDFSRWSHQPGLGSSNGTLCEIGSTNRLEMVRQHPKSRMSRHGTGLLSCKIRKCEALETVEVAVELVELMMEFTRSDGVDGGDAQIGSVRWQAVHGARALGVKTSRLHSISGVMAVIVEGTGICGFPACVQPMSPSHLSNIYNRVPSMAWCYNRQEPGSSLVSMH